MTTPRPFSETGKMAIITSLSDYYFQCRLDLRQAIHLGGLNWRSRARKVSRARRAIVVAEKELGFSPMPELYGHPKPKPKPKPNSVIPDPSFTNENWGPDPF